MHLQPHRLVIWVGAATWVVVTLAALSIVVAAPSEHVDLAVGLALVWAVLVGFAAFSRITERL